MKSFKRTLLAEDGVAKVRSDALGNNTNQYGAYDVGALVKLGAMSMEPVVANDEIYGAVQHVEEYTVNDGYSFGSVKSSHRIKALVGADGDTNAVSVGDLVVADTQPALKGKGSTVQGDNAGHVKVGNPTRHKWEVIWVSGAGATGDEVILEKV